MLFFRGDFRLDLFARKCARDEYDASIAQAAEPVAAINRLFYINR